MFISYWIPAKDTKFQPACEPGFELNQKTKIVKCKKGKISEPDLKCISSGPVTTSTLPVTTSTLPVTTTTSTSTFMSTTANDDETEQTTTKEPLPTDASGCSFANGYLQEITAPKYKPICYPGFEMTEKIKQAGFFSLKITFK